jgi:uracil-DNA glycosylase
MTPPAERAAGAIHPADQWSPSDDLRRVADAVDACRACDLWARATQGVFGEGRRGATIVLVGEQPGDREDLVGRPFVGPAGAMLDKALEEAGIDRAQVYVTNAVKHFKWKASGKKRLHDKPNREQVKACRPWLELEQELVRPDIMVLLGATAAQAILGSGFRVTIDHGKLLEPERPGGPRRLATLHPSAILRARTPEDREEMRRTLVSDLMVAAGSLTARPAG